MAVHLQSPAVIDINANFLFVAIAMFLFPTGCEKLCDQAADPHARYNATVLDNCGAQGQFTCAGLGGGYLPSGPSCSVWDGIISGASLQVQATGEANTSNGTCYNVAAVLTSAPSELTLAGPSTDQNALNQVRNNPFMHAVEDITAGQCEGAFALGFFDTGNPRGIYAQPAVGDVAPAVLYTLFLPSNDNCQPCNDNFAIHLTKE